MRVFVVIQRILGVDLRARKADSLSTLYVQKTADLRNSATDSMTEKEMPPMVFSSET